MKARKKKAQRELFSSGSPPSVRFREIGEEESNALVDLAHSVARAWVQDTHGTARELLATLEERCGTGIRLLLGEVLARLHADPGLTNLDRQYLSSTLSLDEVNKALWRGRPLDGTNRRTIDEFFARVLAARSSAEFVEIVRFVSKFRRYSPYNNMLVYLQRPHASYWATESDWHDRFTRSVKPDAIPIVMLRPKGPIMLVYDLDDTDGPPVPRQILEPFEVTGEFQPTWMERATLECRRDGIGVQGARLPRRHAGSARTAPARGQLGFVIEINRALPIRAQFDTLCHELAHIYLGHLGPHQQGRWPARVGLTRTQRELEAETVAHLVTTRLGLLTKSAEYLAGYVLAEGDLRHISLDMIMKTASRIERMAAPQRVSMIEDW